MNKIKLQTTDTDINNNNLFYIENIEYVSDVWSLLGDRLKFIYNTKSGVLTILGGEVTQIYVLCK